MDLKIRVWNRRDKRLSPRDKLKGLLRSLQAEDSEAALIIGGERVQQEHDVQAGQKFTKGVKLDQKNEGIVFMHAKLLSSKKLNDMKHSPSQILMGWLRDERVFVMQDRWKTEKARLVGYIVAKH